MIDQPLVSIIIPTYNRAHLIGETLDSVVAQTYENWECIVVDDGSSDTTDEVVGEYTKKDTRFKYYHRTNEHLPGGNGARNYGFKMSQGEYIIWFDSDDLMTRDHIEIKYNLINSGELDFAITRTKFFNCSVDVWDGRYEFSEEKISLNNFITQKINWFTLDVIIQSCIADKINYNEALKSGQEFNYFSKLLFLTNKGTYLNKVVSLARRHNNSISTTINTGEGRNKSRAITKWISFQETKSKLNKISKKKILLRIYIEIIKSKKPIKDVSSCSFWSHIALNYRFQFFFMLVYFLVNKHTDRFHFLRKLALRDEN